MKKDDIFKKLFSDKEIFLMFLKDFIKESWIEKMDETKLELVPSLYPDGVESNRESDIIYKITYENKDIFVFILLEHQSSVNYLMSFRVLEYMVKLWRKHIDEKSRKSRNKSFNLPPVYPIIFYDGINKWTASKKFQDKVKGKDIFEKNIPKFEYEIINLNNISFEQLESYEDLLSAILVIDKIKKPEDLRKLKSLGLDYWRKLQNNVKGKRALEKIAEAMNLLLTRINAPIDERERIVDEVYKGRLEKMFEVVEGWDVQETRRVAMQQGIEQGIEQGVRKGIKEGIKKEKIEMIKKGYKKGLSIEMLSELTELDKKSILKIIKKDN